MNIRTPYLVDIKVMLTDPRNSQKIHKSSDYDYSSLSKASRSAVSTGPGVIWSGSLSSSTLLLTMGEEGVITLPPTMGEEGSPLSTLERPGEPLALATIERPPSLVILGLGAGLNTFALPIIFRRCPGRI